MEKEHDTPKIKSERPGVSVTWKWLAITAIGVVIANNEYDRLAVDKRFENNESSIRNIQQQVLVSPTKDDIKDLRASIEKLSDRMDSVIAGRDFNHPFSSPRQQGQ